MNRSLMLPTAIASLIGLAGVLLLLFAWHLPPFAPAMPTTENAYLRGNVTIVAPQLSGYLSAVEVTDFQTVEAGDVIARIDDRIYRQKLAQAEATLASARAAREVATQGVHSAEANVTSGEAALEAARSALAAAMADSTRTEELRARGVASTATGEQVQLALQRAEAEVAQSEAQLEVLREEVNSARAQIATAEAQIATAEAAVELARIDLANTVIHAPGPGKLGQVGARVGQYVSAGTALVSHVGRDRWVIANFKETNLHGLALNQRVDFSVDAMGGRRFTGRVAAFSPAAASEFSLMAGTNATGNFTKIAQRVPVRISIDPGQEGGEHLAPGLSVVVSVETDPGRAL
ncbi:biotin/lipoyl-binding protein [Rhodobacter sphaeroides]|uniref:HlyD family secretion protein n=1 Tax=Cereibacter sphaeroides TaxID=1063 RepID=UPI001329E1B2|nr:HlyD family secretion protein [Cereibacter sphaeroides]MWP38471.1 biotin/lipoyl-binding protein [Cereibacter sphaeroides]